jgi:phosphatidate cytidylyltransferase
VLTRVISAIAVVIVGLIPTFIGGPVFAGLFLVLGILGFREYLSLAALASGDEMHQFADVGFAVIAACGVVAFLHWGSVALFAVVAGAIGAPFLRQLPNTSAVGAAAAMALAATGSLYLGLPVYAAAALRTLPGTADLPWLPGLFATGLFPWDPAPHGLAWTLTVILATWLGDSTALLVGRAVGRRPLNRVVSPKKTVEGAIGGLAASAIVSSACFVTFGLGDWWLGALVGGLIGAAGQLGDLAESFLKRQAGVKDSGNMIPGHGGVLDRIDALLFAFPVAFVVAAVLEGS